MSDAVETYGEMAAFASLREPAWHKLGTVFQNEVSTDEMLKLAHLNNWNVRLVETELAGRSSKTWFQTVRDNPFDGKLDVLGMVGERYRVFQNEELLAFGDNILDGGRWETAGSIKEGTVVFASLALDRDSIIDESGVSDIVKNYLIVFSSHDGSKSINAMVSPVRVVCQNTLNMAVANAKQSFKIRHTETANGKVMAAREALGMTYRYLDEWDKAAEELFRMPVTVDTVDTIFKAVYPEPDKDAKGAFTKWEKTNDTLWNIYNGSTVDAIRNTAWGAYNALTERIDWFRAPRKGNMENIYAASAGFDPVTNANKNMIFKTVRDIAKDRMAVRV